MSNNGVILERLSSKKLSFFVIILISLQVVFFLLGILSFPSATHTETVEGIMCRDKEVYSKWNLDQKNEHYKNNQNSIKNLYYLRDQKGQSKSNCDYIEVDDNKRKVINANLEEIVYAFQIPLPRENRVLRLHRFFQTMTSVLHLQVLFPPSENIVTETTMIHEIPMEVKLAYKNSKDVDDDWHQIASTVVKKEFSCVKGEYSLDCDMIQLFELGSVHHEFYLINLKLGNSKLINSFSNSNNFVPKLTYKEDVPDTRIMLTFIYQTGGFTKMWLIMKTLIFPVVLFVMCWFWNRISQLDRVSSLLEQMLFSLGISLTLLNLPVEWLTLWFDCQWMLLYTDLRQGIFYSTLFTFWIVFCGEHFIDESDNKAWTTFKSYWKYIGIVWLGCIFLLIFELSHRGMQLNDPFFSIWDSKLSSNIAITILFSACCIGVLYFILLMFLVGKVVYNFYSKQIQLLAMNNIRREFYEGIIYRFKFLLAYTVICAAFTVTFFIFNNFNNLEWYFYDDSTEMSYNYSGGFLTGIYGMWNIYASAVMIFYAPSYKKKTIANNNETSEVENMGMQLRLIHTEHIYKTESILSAFVNKISAS